MPRLIMYTSPTKTAQLTIIVNEIRGTFTLANSILRT